MIRVEVNIRVGRHETRTGSIMRGVDFDCIPLLQALSIVFMEFLVAFCITYRMIVLADDLKAITPWRLKEYEDLRVRKELCTNFSILGSKFIDILDLILTFNERFITQIIIAKAS